MKVNLSVDGKEFKNQVQALREKLNECQSNGRLDEEFQQQLEALAKAEEQLLTELIPYYRVYAKNIQQTTLAIHPISQRGAFGFEGFLKSFARIQENLFLLSSIERQVQFALLDSMNKFSDPKQIEMEWSLPLKEINETIPFLSKLQDGTLVLLGIRGGCYLLSGQSSPAIADLSEPITIQKILTDPDFQGLELCCTISDGIFVMQSAEDTLNILELKKENQEYRLVLHTEESCAISGVSCLETIEDNYLAVGTNQGQLHFVKYENGKLKTEETLDILSNRIRQIKCLQDETGSRNTLIAIGDQGGLAAVSFRQGKRVIEMHREDLKGNLFDIQSQQGTAILLSEDGILYLLEENFGNWALNEGATVNDRFFTNVLPFSKSNYLLMDLDGTFNFLHINRIDTPKDLWDLPLYQ
ncbi:hypothetical protein [Clostridium minihomine]|uniref:hypothetical protein n=1 Tax=Clostridium minihomine TaxID=2045012 RepID=UPI000C77D880|nr:hypothetical protein [Clostridium minihomine]